MRVRMGRQSRLGVVDEEQGEFFEGVFRLCLGDLQDALLEDCVEFLHILVEGLFGAIPVVDEGEVGCNFVGEVLGDGLPLLGVELVVVELEVDLADVDFVVVEEGEFVGPVGDLGDFEEGAAKGGLTAVLDAEEDLQLLLLRVNLHREGLVPLQLLLLDEKRGGLEGLLADPQPNEGTLLYRVQHHCLHHRRLYRPAWGVTVVLHLRLLLLVLEDAHHDPSALLPHKRHLEGEIGLVNVVLLTQVDQAHPQELLHPVSFAPRLGDDAFHLRLRELEALVEDVVGVAVVDGLLLRLVVHLPVLQHKEGRALHVLGAQVVEAHPLYADVQGRHLHHLRDFYQRDVDEGDALFVPVEDLHPLVGHLGLVEVEDPRADELVGEEDGEGETRLLIVAFEDGVAVVALLIGGNEVGVDLLLRLPDLHAERWDLFESP